MKCLILGVTGQDGSYLAEIFLAAGDEVHGLIRKSSTGNTANIQHLIDNPELMGKRFFLHRGDLLDPTSLFRVISEVRPQVIFNEADQDHVAWSYDMIGYSSDVTGAAVARILEIIKQIDRTIRYFQPCTSNMFGVTEVEMQDEHTPFNPQSPYAVAKVFAYYMTRYYRKAFGMHASTAILFNHESPRRTADYVTRKITQSVARIALGKQKKLVLGDMSSRVDWGYARDYMVGARAMLLQDTPDDYVIATGEAHSVAEFVDSAFQHVGLDPEKYVETSSEFIRPTKTSTLVGNSAKARAKFGFQPQVRFSDLIRIMVDADLDRERERA